MDVPVYNLQGEKVGTMPIDEQALGGTVNAPLIKQAYVRYHANQRQGSARTLNRKFVSGSTRKIYKQKGTGRARHGNKKPPQFRGGGHWKTKTRTREDFRLDMPKKMRRVANRNALLAKLVDDQVKIIDSLAFEQPKTSAFRKFLIAVGAETNTLVAFSMDEDAAKFGRLSCRNLDGVESVRIDQINCFELLNHRYLVVSKADLEAWLSGPSSQTDKAAKVEPMGAGNGTREPRKSRPKRGYSNTAAAKGGE